MKPYLPSNGTEGAVWTEEWCDNCTRRALDPGAKTQCTHELRALMGEDNEKWYYIDGIPTCLAFRSRKDRKRYPTKRTVDKNQVRMFE